MTISNSRVLTTALFLFVTFFVSFTAHSQNKNSLPDRENNFNQRLLAIENMKDNNEALQLITTLSEDNSLPVSYTHLTLPTNREV